MGTGALRAPRWDQELRVSHSGTRFTLISSPRLSSSSPASLLPLPLAPCLCWCLSLGLPGLSPRQSRRLLRELKLQRRRHAAATTIAAHWRGYQVMGPRALRPPLSCCPCHCVSLTVSVSIILSVCPGCLPTPLLPTLSGWSFCPLHWGQIGMGRCGGREGRDTLVFVGLVVMSDVLTSGAVPADTQDLQEVFPFQRQHLLGQLHLPAAGEWGWGRGGPRCLPSPLPWGWTVLSSPDLPHCHLQVQKYLVGLAKNLPPLSVTDRTWPPAPYRFLDNTNQELKNIFYHWKVGAGGGGEDSRWGSWCSSSPQRSLAAPNRLLPRQCKKYRDQLQPSRRAQLQAKLCASELFKDKKTLYPKRCQGRGLGVQGSSG